MGIKVLVSLLFIIQSFNLESKRTLLTVEELKKNYPVVIAGYVTSEESNENKVLVLQNLNGSSKNKISIRRSSVLKKPNENIQVGKIYLLFLKQEGDEFSVGRSVLVKDLLIEDSQLEFKAIKENCAINTVSCLLNSNNHFKK